MVCVASPHFNITDADCLLEVDALENSIYHMQEWNYERTHGFHISTIKK